MSQWINLLGYQLTWFLTVSGAGRGKPWPGIVITVLFCAGQVALSQWRGLDLRLMAAGLLLGMGLDGFLATSGLVAYAASSAAVPFLGCPLWILALWLAFATTLTRSLAWLRGRLWVASVFGALGGPLAYWGAARGWGAVTLIDPAWRAVFVLAIGWGVALAILAGGIAGKRTVLRRNVPVEEA